ncbi:MAG: FecR family protein [Bacteroidales bacterium]|jgi:ferric-dicitrate binding protein FerR (iron transport regulator)|nr:FecR family protein [Bacteroidales bacterium]
METPYELLISYCRKQTSQEENQYIEQWLSEDDNLALFLDLRKEWRYIDDPSMVVPDKSLVWWGIQAKTGLRKKRKVRKLKYSGIIATASIAVILAISTVLYYMGTSREIVEPEQYTTFSTRSKEKSEIKLADGTQVWLNVNSHLTFSNQYNTKNREVTVSGELFFDVMKSDKKFIIHAGKVKIEVMGTSFNLKTSGINDQVEISLKTGKIAVFGIDTGRQLFVMDSSQYASVNKTDLAYSLHEQDTSISNIWTEENLAMYNEPLVHIIEKLEKWYGIEITCTGLEMDKRYTFYIQGESLLDFLDLFSTITPIDYSIDGKKVNIEAKK